MEQSLSPARRSISMAAITSSTEHRPVIDPSTYLAKETLKDGTEVTIRAIQPEDSTGVLESFEKLDRDAIYRRFFSLKKELTDAAYRGRGIAGLLLRHLIRLAQKAGISRLEADVLADNHPMLAVFRRSGLPMRQQREGSVIHLTLDLQLDRS